MNFEQDVFDCIEQIRKLANKKNICKKDLWKIKDCFALIYFHIHGMGINFEKVVKEKLNQIELKNIISKSYEINLLDKNHYYN